MTSTATSTPTPVPASSSNVSSEPSGWSLPPASSAVADEAGMRDWAAALVEQARAEGVELTGDGGLLTGLVRQVLQTGLEVEMSDHVGYEPHAVEGRGSGNSRNGSYPKTVTTEIGKADLRVPRLAGDFWAVLLKQPRTPSHSPAGVKALAPARGSVRRLV